MKRNFAQLKLIAKWVSDDKKKVKKKKNKKREKKN